MHVDFYTSSNKIFSPVIRTYQIMKLIVPKFLHLSPNHLLLNINHFLLRVDVGHLCIDVLI